jgi:hypothetical protein
VRWPPAWELVNWSNRAVMRYSPDINDVSAEAEDSPLLRSVTGKRLMKADLEDLAFVVVIYKAWRLAIVLYLLVGTICKWSINLISNPNPVYIVLL